MRLKKAENENALKKLIEDHAEAVRIGAELEESLRCAKVELERKVKDAEAKGKAEAGKAAAEAAKSAAEEAEAAKKEAVA
ncbi:unnamed protein product, partial [Cuscuta epithymum]